MADHMVASSGVSIEGRSRESLAACGLHNISTVFIFLNFFQITGRSFVELHICSRCPRMPGKAQRVGFPTPGRRDEPKLSTRVGRPIQPSGAQRCLYVLPLREGRRRRTQLVGGKKYCDEHVGYPMCAITPQFFLHSHSIPASKTLVSNTPLVLCCATSSASPLSPVSRIGANRIVLFDSDWNPATDCQVGMYGCMRANLSGSESEHSADVGSSLSGHTNFCSKFWDEVGCVRKGWGLRAVFQSHCSSASRRRKMAVYCLHNDRRALEGFEAAGGYSCSTCPFLLRDILIYRVIVCRLARSPSGQTLRHVS